MFYSYYFIDLLQQQDDVPLSFPVISRWCQQVRCPARRAAARAPVKVVVSRAQRVKPTGPRSSWCSGPTAWKKPWGRSSNRLRKVKRTEVKPFSSHCAVGIILFTSLVCKTWACSSLMSSFQWWTNRTDTRRSRGCRPRPPSKEKTARSWKMLSHVSVPLVWGLWSEVTHFKTFAKTYISVFKTQTTLSLKVWRWLVRSRIGHNLADFILSKEPLNQTSFDDIYIRPIFTFYLPIMPLSRSRKLKSHLPHRPGETRNSQHCHLQWGHCVSPCRLSFTYQLPLNDDSWINVMY